MYNSSGMSNTNHKPYSAALLGQPKILQKGESAPIPRQIEAIGNTVQPKKGLNPDKSTEKAVDKVVEKSVKTESKGEVETSHTIGPPKKTKSVSLFDLIASKKTTVKNEAFAATSIGISSAAKRLPSKPSSYGDVNASFQSTTAKSFIVQTKKKKKKLSTIKKRILMERMLVNVRRQLDLDAQHPAVEGALKILDESDSAVEESPQELLSRKYASYSVLKLCGFAEASELQDQEEREEIVSNIKGLFLVCGEVKDILVGWNEVDPSEDCVSESSCPLPESIPLYLSFDSFATARMACLMSNGLVVGGQVVMARVCNSSNLTDVLENDVLQINSPPNAPGGGEAFVKIGATTSTNDGRPDTRLKLLPSHGVVMIENLIDVDQSLEEDEVAELLGDIKQLVSGEGLIAAWIARKSRAASTVDTSNDTNDAVQLAGYELAIEFDTIADASVAVAALEGLVIGGEAVQAALFDVDAFNSCDYQRKYLVPAGRDNDFATKVGALVIVSNYWTADDDESACFEGPRPDFDGFVACKKDLVDLIASRSGKQTHKLGIVRITTVGLASQSSRGNVGDCDNQFGAIVAGVLFASRADALRSMLALDGTIVGGKHLAVYCLPAMNSEEANLCLRYGYDEDYLKCLLAGQPEEDNKSIVSLAGRVFEDRANMTPSATDADDAAAEAAVDEANAGGTEAAAIGSGVEQAPLSRLELLKITPKLGKHADGKPHIKVASEELDGIIKEMLSALATFQARAKEQDPLKAKQKQRFVIGLKQVLNGAKAGRAKLILLSPDTECSEALDDKVDVVIAEAAAKEIPVLYCLSRRKIGKAIGLTTRQSALAIYDPAGAYEQFKKTIQFINAPVV